MTGDLRGRVKAAAAERRTRPPAGGKQQAPAAAADGNPAGTGAAAAEQALARANVVADLRRLRNQFAVALGKAGDPDQLIRDVMTELRRVPDLLAEDTDPLTVLGAAMTCAQLGLRPGVNGQAYILPFWSKTRQVREATFVAGYRGLAKLAHQSRLITGLSARTVYERDGFSFTSEHDGDKMRHEPALTAPDRGKPLLYYARATLPNGGYQLTEPTSHALMIAFRVEHVKIQSGPWYDDRGTPGCGFEWMAWKTMVKRLSKLLPLDSNMAMAIEADEGVRTNLDPHADVEKVTEQEREAAIPGEWSEGPDWNDVPDARPAAQKGEAK